MTDSSPRANGLLKCVQYSHEQKNAVILIMIFIILGRKPAFVVIKMYKSYNFKNLYLFTITLVYDYTGTKPADLVVGLSGFTQYFWATHWVQVTESWTHTFKSNLLDWFYSRWWMTLQQLNIGILPFSQGKRSPDGSDSRFPTWGYWSQNIG